MPTTEVKTQWKVGATLSLEVQSLSDRGVGVAAAEGRTALIRGALPGERVEAVLTRVRSSRAEGRILKVERPAAERAVPRCRHFGPCGGCDLQHLAYPAQLRWRMSRVTEILRREMAGHALPPVQEVAMPEPWGYRSKMEFTFGEERGRITLGLHERASFRRIVDVTRCEIAPPAVSDLVGAIKEVAAGFPARSYHPGIHQGFWRYAVIRAARRGGELLAVIVTNEGPREPIEALARELPRRIPALQGLYWGVSAKVSDVAHPERLELLHGAGTLEDQVGPVRFLVGPSSFIQPNGDLVGPVYEAIREKAALTGIEAVYDLYCGMGLIGLTLAGRARVVYGVESERENVAFAERNAALNGAANALFLCGKVEEVLKGRALFKAGPSPDVVVLDPPRAGLHREVIAPLLQAAPARILYLSCNPASIGRDLKILLERETSYRVEAVQFFDFFPHTVHAEVLVTLRRG